MPALTANSVTLDEILEVRAGPLREDELWAVLCQSCEGLQDVLIKGKHLGGDVVVKILVHVPLKDKLHETLPYVTLQSFH